MPPANGSAATPRPARRRPIKPVSAFTVERLAEITADPRLYGFHGTLKAPIALADGVTERDLLAAAGNFAVGRRSVIVPSMTLACMSGFMALVPSQPSAELQDLADSCVIEFDEFRQPADEAELARRRAAGLSPRQEELLLRWGYPYVLEEWRFHLTLTGRIGDDGERSAITDLLRRQFVRLHRPAAAGARSLRLSPARCGPAVHRPGALHARRRTPGE